MYLVSDGIQESDVKIEGAAANSVTLASAIICRLQNPKVLALHYRISTILSSSCLNPCSVRKVEAFCKRALKASSLYCYGSQKLNVHV